MRVAKAHGLGNDFLLVDAADAPADAPAWARLLCERHVGIGADGVIAYRLTADGVAMRLWNADGGEAEISGNGLRCLAGYMVFRGLRPPRHVVTTVAGPRPVEVEAAAPTRFRISTEMGRPILASDAIPVRLQPAAEPVVDHILTAAGRELRVTATSMGNPHCALFFDDVADDGLVRELGPALERHSFFPNRTNVEFVTVTSRDALRVRFWERGVGPTSASGTGAASAAVASMITGRVDRRVSVVCDGGVLEVEWPEGGAVRQTGEVEVLFEGDWLG